MTAQTDGSGADPDRLYAERTNLASAKQAADIWSAMLTRDPQSFEASWKLARACYWLGSHAPSAERKTYLERGLEAAQTASKLQPMRPEGHFWTAANMGTMAESFGLSAGLKYRKPVRTELETVLKLDPAYQQGSADRALGRWYYKVPGLFGGSNTKAEEHLKASLKYNPQSTVTHFFLAELYFDEHRDAEARAELQKVLDAPLDPDWAPEDRGYQEKAREMLSKK